MRYRANRSTLGSLKSDARTESKDVQAMKGGPPAAWQGPQEHEKESKNKPRKADNSFAPKADISICSQQSAIRRSLTWMLKLYSFRYSDA
jgi:hypothetical protein